MSALIDSSTDRKWSWYKTQLNRQDTVGYIYMCALRPSWHIRHPHAKRFHLYAASCLAFTSMPYLSISLCLRLSS